VDGTWENNHTDQVIIRVRECTGVNTVAKKIIFKESINITGVESCICYEINAIFVNYSGRGNAA
jgi:hypothetical protein